MKRLILSYLILHGWYCDVCDTWHPWWRARLVYGEISLPTICQCWPIHVTMCEKQARRIAKDVGGEAERDAEELHLLHVCTDDVRVFRGEREITDSFIQRRRRRYAKKNKRHPESAV